MLYAAALITSVSLLVPAVSPTPDELATAAAWAGAHFEPSSVSDAEDATFFSCNGQAFKNHPVESAKQSTEQGRKNYTLRYREGNLGARVQATVYADFPVVEWTLFLKNEGDEPITVRDPQAINSRFFGPGDLTLHHNAGDNCTADSYMPLTTALSAGMELRLANTGGRPTQTTFPYFNVAARDRGMIFVVAWPGQWFARFDRNGTGGLSLVAGQEQVNARLQPQEEIRTPTIVLLFWNGEGEIARLRAQNLWRAWMIAHVIPRPGNHLPPLPQLAACSSHQFGEMINADSQSQKYFVDKYLERGFKLDYWWMDAGWYWCDGNWPKTGTWEVDTNRFPGGLRPISDYALDKGVRTIVWFEPERVHKDTWLADTHPQWVLGGKKGGLLNLGDLQAWNWLVNHIDGLIKSQGVHLYRQDFNMDPLEFWRRNDAPDREGMTENRHVQAYLAYWDELSRRNPNMLIDSCASGGRRNDLETLRRSVPLLRSDYIMEPTGNQCHTWAISQWIPFYGTGTSKTDPYLIRSVLCPHFIACWDMRDDQIDYKTIKNVMDQWTSVADCYFGDYYPLTPYSLREEDWIAWQFDRPEQGRGFVQAFRRPKCETDCICVKLYGLRPATSYKIYNLDRPEEAQVLTGDQLNSAGAQLKLTERPGAGFWQYSALN